MRVNLIKLVHVARRKLSLDDDTYRVMLSEIVPGKTSCRDMTVPELERVLKAMQERGFKRTPGPVKTGSKSAPIVADKIRVIWQIMHEQGFTDDASPAALDAFVMRSTKQKNGGMGVARISWLRGDQASKVLESLKRWHMRCMLEKLPESVTKPTYNRVCERYQALRNVR